MDTDLARKIDLEDENPYVFDPNFEFSTCWTYRHPYGPYDEHDVAQALIHERGNISAAARKLGRRAAGVRRAIDREPKLRTLVQEMREERLDGLEDGIFTSAEAGDNTDRRFLLSTLGKHRGFTQKTDVEHGGAVSNKMEIVWSGGTDEVLKVGKDNGAE